jgi:hypothetical protein
MALKVDTVIKMKQSDEGIMLIQPPWKKLELIFVDGICIHKVLEV